MERLFLGVKLSELGTTRNEEKKVNLESYGHMSSIINVLSIQREKEKNVHKGVSDDDFR